jgi:hypothetical protein
VHDLEAPWTDQFGFDRLDRAKAAAALLRIETVLSPLVEERLQWKISSDVERRAAVSRVIVSTEPGLAT